MYQNKTISKFYFDLVAYLSSLQSVSNRNSYHNSAYNEKLNKSLNSDQFTDDEFESLNNEQDSSIVNSSKIIIFHANWSIKYLNILKFRLIQIEFSCLKMFFLKLPYFHYLILS